MAEKIEFIAAKDLPTTEAEEVGVLCIENGELKQKPANGLGGSAVTVLIGSTQDAESSSIVPGTITFQDGQKPTAQQIYDAFKAGVVVLDCEWPQNKTWQAILLAAIVNTDAVKCVYVGPYGQLQNFDYPGTVAE